MKGQQIKEACDNALPLLLTLLDIGLFFVGLYLVYLGVYDLSEPPVRRTPTHIWP